MTAISRANREFILETFSDHLMISSWHTPLTDVAPKTIGSARLSKTTYKKGETFRAEGVGGFEYFTAEKPLTITCLQRNEDDHPDIRYGNKRKKNLWRTWMVDDYTHWNGMKELCDRMPGGHIVCAGLGLGLMVHHLTARKAVRKITVVEIDKDVIDLTGPTVPHDKLQIVNEDYYRWLRIRKNEPIDAILWDLAVGGPDQTRPDMLTGYVQTVVEAPNVPLFQFGMKEGRNTLFD